MSGNYEILTSADEKTGGKSPRPLFAALLKYPFGGEDGGAACLAAAQIPVVAGDLFRVGGFVKGQYGVYEALTVLGENSGPGV